MTNPEEHEYWDLWNVVQDECPEFVLEQMLPRQLENVRAHVLARGIKCMALANYFGLLENSYFAPFAPCVRQEGCAIVKDDFEKLLREQPPEFHADERP